MYFSCELDGRLSLLDREKSYRDFYHSHLHNQTQDSVRTKREVGVDSLEGMLGSGGKGRRRRGCNPELREQMKLLEELKLDSPKGMKRVVYEGSNRAPTVHNDYHSRASNHGYSRS